MPARLCPVRISWLPTTTVLFALLTPYRLAAQSLTQGSLLGEIVLRTGAAVPDAAVTIEDEGGAAVRRLGTDRRGIFSIPLLAPGTYSILVEKTGFQPFRQRGVVVLADQQTSLSVIVTRRPPPITSVEESTIPDQRFVPGTPRITEILGGPEFQRDAVRLDLAETGRFSTGVLSPGAGGWGLGDVVGSFPQTYNRLSIDGLPAFSMRHPGVEIAPSGLSQLPPYMLRETRLVSNASDAELQGGPGGVVSVVTRPGTRSFHLEPFASWGGSPGLSSELNPSGSSTKSLLVGSAVSGTLVKDKAQFILGANYESLDLPSARPWTRDSALLGASRVPLLATINQIAQDSFTTDASRGTKPALRTYRGGMANLGIDWELSRQHRLTIRAAGGKHTEKNPLLGIDVLNGSNVGLESRDFLASVGLSSSWTSISNEFHVGIQSATRDWSATGPATTYFVSDEAGIGALPTAPGYFKRSAFEFVESALYQFGSAGENRVKIGFSYSDGTWNQDYVYGKRGIYQFGDLGHFQSDSGVFTDVIAGRTDVSFRVREIGLFSHLQWRFTSGLTGVAGIRWDRQKFPASALLRDTTFANAFGIRNNRLPDDNLNLSPRLGVMWNAGPGQRWTATLVGAIDNGLLNPDRFVEAVLDKRNLTVRRTIGSFTSWPVPPDTTTLPRGGRRFALFSPTGDYRNPRTKKLDLDLNRRLPGGFSFGLTGRYHHTDYLLRRSDLNLPAAPTGTTQEGRAVYGTLVQSGGLIVASPGTNRRLTNFDLVSAFSSTGAQDFYEAVARISRDFGHGLSVSAAYSLSRTRDNWPQSWSGDPADELSPFPDQPQGRGWAKGISDFDIPQRGVVAATWHSSGRFRVNVAGRFRVQSGFPFTPGFQPGVDANGDGSGRNDPAFLDPTIPGLPSVVPQHSCLGNQVGSFARRNSCRDPGRQALDLGGSVALPMKSLGSPIELTLDLINLVSSRAGVVDHALVLIDPTGTIVTDPAGNVTLPLVANPHFGKLLSRRDEPRIVRIGVRLGNW